MWFAERKLQVALSKLSLDLASFYKNSAYVGSLQTIRSSSSFYTDISIYDPWIEVKLTIHYDWGNENTSN